MTDTPLRIGLISLGCAKNLVDSEVMLGSLLRAGAELVADHALADVLIVNTCGFIEAAKQESIEAILKANDWRRHGRCRALIMAGCLTQRYPQDLRRDLPEVDAIVGLNEVPRLPAIVQEILARHGDQPGPSLHWSGPATFVPDFAAPRFRLTPPHYAWVKIAEGCNHPCSFCSIPRIRGRHRSRPVDDIVAEVRALVAAGTREVNLISQDTTFYGRDLTAAGVNGSLPVLLRALQAIPGDFWVRILYTHPAHWTDELIDTIADCDKVCRYIDMPLQHINDDVLRRMKRETDGAHIRALVARLRARLPGVTLRTTFIAGFPGETEAQFEELLEFIKQTRFERLGVFGYSREDHTPAGTLSGQVSARVKQQRRARAMRCQQRVAGAVHRAMVGQTVRVLVERALDHPPRKVFGKSLPRHAHGQWWVGRSMADAPDIDGRVYVHGPAKAGEFAAVRLTAAATYDLAGRVCP